MDVPEEQSYDVSGQRSVGINPIFEMNNNQQLREQDNIHQVRTHGPVKRFGFLHIFPHFLCFPDDYSELQFYAACIK